MIDMIEPDEPLYDNNSITNLVRDANFLILDIKNNSYEKLSIFIAGYILENITLWQEKDFINKLAGYYAIA